eukprot:snap_masked-scaffold_20-processed-gene-3.0-mRNA-1 protein AED:1.00 eAED:1.00 QI:0/0/0/0/1/1/2/0/60
MHDDGPERFVFKHKMTSKIYKVDARPFVVRYVYHLSANLTCFEFKLEKGGHSWVTREKGT